jgi:hypothetical protein
MVASQTLLTNTIPPPLSAAATLTCQVASGETRASSGRMGRARARLAAMSGRFGAARSATMPPSTAPAAHEAQIAPQADAPPSDRAAITGPRTK